MTGHAADPDEHRAMAGLARGGLANLIGTGVTAVCQFAVVLIVTRLFSTADAGALFAATAIFLIVVAVVELGLDQGLVRYIAWYRARSDVASLGALLRVALVPAALASLVGVLCVAAGASAMARWFGGDTGDVATTLRVLAVAVPFAAATDVLLAATRGFGIMRPTVLVERILRALLQPLAILAVGLGGGGLVALTFAWVAPYVVSAVAAAIALRRLWVARAARWRNGVHGARASGRDSGADDEVTIARAFWSYTSARAVARVFQVLLQRVDIVIVAALLGTRDAAIYTAATRCIAMGQLLNLAIQQVIQPRLAELLAVDEHGLAQLVLRRTTTALVALAWPGYLAIIAVAPWLMGIFGPGYEDGAATLVILSVAMLVATAAGPLDVVLLMAGRSTISLLNMLAGLVVDVLGCVLLLPVIGLDGAAWAWAAAIVVRNGLGVLVTRKALNLTAGSRELARVIVWAVVSCGVPATVAALVGAPLLLVATLLAAGGVVYGGYLLRHRDVLGITPGGFRHKGLATS